ncbi:MAG: GAF domain-containing protein [Magnetococcales bacterium]|nr:GAF domain-containing protein [Magnetococcales bacterium]
MNLINWPGSAAKKREARKMRDHESQRAINALLKTSIEAHASLQEQFEIALGIILSVSWSLMDDRAAIFLFDKKRNNLTLTAHRNFLPDMVKTCSEIPVGKCLCGKAAELKELVFVSSHDSHETQVEGIHPHGHYCVPILSKDMELQGVLTLYLPEGHVRDSDEEVFLSTAAGTLAEMIQRSKTEKELTQSMDGSQLIQMLLHSAMEPVPLQDQLDQVLIMLFYLPWLQVQPKGAIFITDPDTGDLVLRAYSEDVRHLFDTCGRVPFGRCICGRAALEREIIHADFDDPRHDIKSLEMETPHRHCCIPILADERVLGVMNLYLNVGQQLSQENEDFLRSIASILSVIIQRHEMDDRVRKALADEKEANEKLDRANHFIRKTFGRYMSDEVVKTILDTPDGLELGGEQREVTVMMTDLRGFTAVSERMAPEDVITMLNLYLEAMTEIIHQYNGTIIEFLGDGILVLFGAPIPREDDAQRAVACALAMQLAMPKVNEKNRELGYPQMVMGGGINTGLVIAGNIGSDKRSKYGVVGNAINLTARIESLTVGGQILISESTRNACGPILRIDDEWRVAPKGVSKPISVFQVGGIEGVYQIRLPEMDQIVVHPLHYAHQVRLMIMDGKYAAEEIYDGRITAINYPLTEITTPLNVDRMTNLKVELFNKRGEQVSDQLFGKVLDVCEGVLTVYFTSVPQRVEEKMRDFT